MEKQELEPQNNLEITEKEMVGEEIKETPEIILEGFEGRVFEDVVFKSSTNKKGKTTYKSSDPSRKIIILSDSSDLPEEGQTYKVVIVEDTDPASQMEGKLMAKIISQDVGEEEAEESVLNLKIENEAKKNEGKLTPEDRERLDVLIKKCIANNVGVVSLFLYEGTAKEQIHIDLKKELRKEGSKAVSYILELSRAVKKKGGEADKIFEYSRLLNYAATEKDAKKVMEFYNLDLVALDTDRSTKSGISKIMGRIGSADDAEALNRYHEKVLKTEYPAGRKERSRFREELKIADAGEVIQALMEISYKTTEPAQIKKIKDIMDRIRGNLERTYGREPFNRRVEGPEQINKLFEEEFYDAEYRRAVHEFENYWDNARFFDEIHFKVLVPDVLDKFISASEKYHYEDKMPEMLNEAYWKLLLRECENPRDTRFKKAADMITDKTGISPDYRAMDDKIQRKYRHAQDYQILDFAQEIFRKTGVAYKIDKKEVQEQAFELMEGDPDKIAYLKKFIPAMEEITGLKIDLSEMGGKIQEIYKKIILNSRVYEKTNLGYRIAIPDYLSTPSLRNAEILFEITGIKPEIDQTVMVERYKSWLNEKHAVNLIQAGIRISGVAPDFREMESEIQLKYSATVNSINDEDSFTVAKYTIVGLEAVTGIKPVFDESVVQTIYSKFLARYYLSDPTDEITNLEKLTGISPDFRSHKEQIHKLYVKILSTFSHNRFNMALGRVKNLKELSGIELDFDSKTVNEIYDYVIRNLRTYGNISQVFKLEEFLPNPGLEAKVLLAVFVDSIEKLDRESFQMALQKMKEQKLLPHVDIKGLVKGYIKDDPKRVLNILKFLRGESQDDEFIFMIQKEILHDPWTAALIKLEKIQGVAINEDNDPWDNELKPLIHYAFEDGLISIDRAEDAELLVSFIEAVGMKNLPNLFDIFIDCRKNKSPENLKADTIKAFDKFGIKIKNKDGTWRFKSSLEIFNELTKGFKNMRSDLLADKIPFGIETDIGISLFDQIRGNTQWEREDEVPVIVSKWHKTVEKNPSIAELPPGFQEATIKVPLIERETAESVTKDQSEELMKLFSGKEVADAYLPLAEAWDVALNSSLVLWFNKVRSRFYDEEIYIRELLARTPEELNTLAELETDPLVKQSLIKKVKALQNPKGRQGIERQADLLHEVYEKIPEIYEQNFDFVEEYEAALEAFNKLDGKVNLSKEIRELSAFHMLAKIMGEGWEQFVAELYARPGNEGTAPTVERIYCTHKLSKDYVEEHYLHHLQDEEHTEHRPFSPELMEKLNQVWQQQLDKKTGHMPITVLRNRLDEILGVGKGKTQKEIGVTMVPVSGLFNIYSGDLGDSCHSSKHEDLAKGKFPNLRTWVYVTNRGKQNEELRGSALAIMSETKGSRTDKTPVLIFRANNPKENFVQTVDAEKFVVEGLKEVVNTARRMREERMKNNPSLPVAQMRQIVAIPMDKRGQASTNRQPVNDVYRRRFYKNAEKLGLKNTPDTNFNTHNLWDKDKPPVEDFIWGGGSVYSIVVWEIDENGEEKWHGDWD